MRNTMKTLVVLTLAAPVAASAQVQSGATASAEAVARATTPAAAADASAEARIRAAIARAADAGVPEAMLERKAAEGRAKGVAAARIAAAVEHRAEVLARVQGALQSGSEGTLQAGADAHERGVSLDALTRLSADAGDDRAVALSVLADLVASGQTSPANALLRVEAALSRGGSALVSLGSSTAATVGAALRAATVDVSADGAATVTRPAVNAASRVGVRIGH